MTAYSCMAIEAPRCFNNHQHSTTDIFSVSIANVVAMCEAPSLINMWCKCVLSGWKGDVPFRIRVDMTRSVSKIGMQSTASAKGINTTVGLA